MAGLSADYINPFLMAAKQVLKNMCGVDAEIGKPFLKDAEFTSDSIVIIIGVTGEMRGQVMLGFENPVACDIASKMCMMPITVLDEISTSAICELGNMIMGNTATLFSNNDIGIDITPPTLCTGDVSFSANFTRNICIPIKYGEHTIEFNLSLKEDRK
ncbi:MAG: chemotaxis protein CheX [Lachnospiraceae bacterium]|nr:chemotaxis protein CheX [Lachnospiraceae bacterium]